MQIMAQVFPKFQNIVISRDEYHATNADCPLPDHAIHEIRTTIENVATLTNEEKAPEIGVPQAPFGVILTRTKVSRQSSTAVRMGREVNARLVQCTAAIR